MIAYDEYTFPFMKRINSEFILIIPRSLKFVTSEKYDCCDELAYDVPILNL